MTPPEIFSSGSRYTSTYSLETLSAEINHLRATLSQSMAEGGLSSAHESLLRYLSDEMEREARPNETLTGAERHTHYIAKLINGIYPGNQNFAARVARVFYHPSMRKTWTGTQRDIMLNTGVCFPLQTVFDGGTAFQEARIGKHPMKKVAADKMRPGDTLRSTVEVEVVYDNGQTGGGSGFFIEFCKEQFIVTAGHIVVNNRFGHAVAVKVSAGRGTRFVETGNGKYVAVHAGWYTCRWGTNDIAFIALDRTFSSVSPLPYQHTPSKSGRTQVSGYPDNYPNDGFFPNGELHVSKDASMTYNPSKEKHIHHDADTETGTSGGPIYRERTKKVIGVHTGSSKDKDGKPITNLGAPIDRSGNDFEPMLTMLLNEHKGISGGAPVPTRIGGATRLGEEAVAFTWYRNGVQELRV
ncbi:trypsin-like cysteine/serine peptidase domain-containing protein [Cladorrhinum sp. PSN332]|nr:trypsin-like cysteine/serine peptidase domain-containing protein [Cladorrhinum sp. PSN332]